MCYEGPCTEEFKERMARLALESVWDTRKRHFSSQRFHDILKELGDLYDKKTYEEPPPYRGPHTSRCGGGCTGFYYANPCVPCGCNCH